MEYNDFSSWRTFEQRKESKFTCPICSKEYYVIDAVVENIVTKSEHVGTKVSGRRVTRTYRDTSYDVRFCSKCYKRKHNSHIVLRVIMFILLPTLYSINYFANHGAVDFLGFLSFLGFLLMFFFLHALIYSLLVKFVDAVFFSVDIEKAIRDNAIHIFSVFDLLEKNRSSK